MNTEPDQSFLERWFAPMQGGVSCLAARWIWLRALGAIFFSAFLALWFQIDGMIGPRGISPAGEYLQAVKRAFPGIKGVWFAPTLRVWLAPTVTVHSAPIVSALSTPGAGCCMRSSSPVCSPRSR